MISVWLPYVRGGSGSDVYTETLASALSTQGIGSVTRPFPGWFQYAPGLLKGASAPSDVNLSITNSWNGFALKRQGIPMVAVVHHSVHGLADHRSRAQAWFHAGLIRRFEAATFRESTAVVAVSEATQRAVREEFAVDSTVIRNAVDTSFFTPDPGRSLRDPDQPFRLLFVGNFSERKGSDLIIPILDALGDRYELAYTAGLRGRNWLDHSRAVPLGQLDRIGLREAYRNADALLLPSRVEGGPLVAMEALACGLPVVGSNLSAIPEVVEHGVRGLLSPLGVDQFVHNIVTLAANPQLHFDMGVEASRYAERELSLETAAGRYVELLTEVVQ